MTVRDDKIAQFNYRVAGVCIRDGHVLLHRGEPFDFWAMPGGRPELLEISTDALSREMLEEMGLQVEVGRLLWLVENFFEYDGQRFHELALYFHMTLPARPGSTKDLSDFAGFEGNIPIIFRWFPIERLEEVALYPALLSAALSDLPATPVHLIQTDAPHEPEALA